jgi:hypothetical protein
MHVSDLSIEQVKHLGYFGVEAMLQIVPGKLAIRLYTVCKRGLPHTKRCSSGRRKYLPPGDQDPT